MKKLFISQPMNGKTDEEILKVREEATEAAKEYLKDEEIEVLDTFYDDFTPDAKPLEYLARALSDLAHAEVAYFAPGWESARGCWIEHECAEQYGIDTIEEYDGNAKPEGINFGVALELVKQGIRIAREGWDSRGMFVVYQKGYPGGIPCNKQTAEAWGTEEGSLFICNPYLQIRCKDGSHSMWVPTIDDVLADDWVIAE